MGACDKLKISGMVFGWCFRMSCRGLAVYYCVDGRLRLGEMVCRRAAGYRSDLTWHSHHVKWAPKEFSVPGHLFPL